MTEELTAEQRLAELEAWRKEIDNHHEFRVSEATHSLLYQEAWEDVGKELDPQAPPKTKEDVLAWVTRLRESRQHWLMAAQQLGGINPLLQGARYAEVPGYDRFTSRSRTVWELALAELHRSEHPGLNTGHLLLGLIKEPSGVASHVLKDFGVRLDKARQALAEHPTWVAHSQTDRVCLLASLEAAVTAAAHLKHNYIGTEHLLLGLLDMLEGPAIWLLEHLGVTVANMRHAVLVLLTDPPYPDPPEPDSKQRQAKQPTVPVTSKVETITRVLTGEAKLVEPAPVPPRVQRTAAYEAAKKAALASLPWQGNSIWDNFSAGYDLGYVANRLPGEPLPKPKPKWEVFERQESSGSVYYQIEWGIPLPSGEKIVARWYQEEHLVYKMTSSAKAQDKCNWLNDQY